MSDRGDPGFTFAGVMILAALGTFAWRSAPLESARQPSDLVPQYQTAEQGRIPARLWQDPLKAAQIFQQKQPDANRPEGGPSAQPLWADIERLAHQDSCDLQARLTVLSVMLSPGSYSEIEERRRRRRYAVLSGLGDSGFVPRDAETLGILRIAEKRASLAADSGNDKGTGLPASSLDVPYEWYDYENPLTGSPCRDAAGSQIGERSSVLVLWLDESRFSDQPFKRFAELVASLLPDSTRQESNLKLQWKVLGPARSGTLRNFVANQCADSVRWLRNESRLDAFHILSPVATVSDLDLAKHHPEAGCDDALKNGDNSDAGVLLGPYFTQPCAEQGKTCLRFLRTIRSDDVLISELKDELRERRGLKEQEHVVVLSEWDTYFGRFLPRAFAASGLDDGGTRRAPEKADLKLLRYTYERGIDGFAAGVKPIDPEQPASNQDQILDQLYPTEGVAVRRPEGTGQFDYIRRLADIILSRDRELRLSTGQGIRAVAIFGSDVYDKLLILRALRPRLPGTIWVTTDLDAHFLHPSEFPWTRNLVAASTFDLMPPRNMQPSSPPFRSSYQTAVYIATRMAVDMATLRRTTLLPVSQDGPSDAVPYPTQEQMYEAIPPRLFEVGRHGFVPLGTAAFMPAQGALSVSAIGAGALHSPALAYFIGVGLIAVLALFALHLL